MGTANVRPLYRCLLACLHIREFPAPEPRSKDVVWCADCREYQAFIALAGTWKIKCHGCNYSFSAHSEERARDMARGHAARKPTHQIILTLDAQEVAVLGAQVEQLPGTPVLDRNKTVIPY